MGLDSGHGFDANDMTGATKVALLGQTVAKSLFGDTDPLDQVIRIRKVPFTVVGVLERKGQNLFGQDQDDVILVPLSSARKRVLGGLQAKQRAVNTIWVKVREGYDMKVAESQIRDVLRQRHACSRARMTTSSCATFRRSCRPGKPHRGYSRCFLRRSPRCRCWWAASAS